MTVENQTNKTAAQVMGSYNYDFLFTVLPEDPTEEDAKEAVKVLISDGTTTQNLTYGTDYTVTLNENGTGGRVTVFDRKTSDWTLIVYREYGYTQGSDYNNYNAFPAETLERNLDKLTMITQQLSEESSRSVKVGMFSDATPAEFSGMIEDLWEIKDDMTTDAANISSITTTAGSIANVNAVAGSIANVNAVAENETNINAAVANATNINAAVANESNINTAVSNMAAIIDAPNQASAASASAALAEDWASKTDGPVEGAEYSAKWYALNTDASGKANKDLANSPYTTNRILEIPQDIKLELNNGTLTLKAGSKVYVPNGFESDGTTPKFDVVTITQDLTNTGSQQDKFDIILNVILDKTTLQPLSIGRSVSTGSGINPPVNGIYFDTSTNKIGAYSSGSINYYCSFPIGIVTDTTTSQGSGHIKSIDQVFNGFGYIGSTVFVLPGVKVQAPNGKNTDGTYKSNILTQLSVGLTNFQFDTSGALVFRPNSSTPLFDALWHFDSENGYISTSDNVPTNEGACILCGYVRVASSKIVDFTFGDVDSVANSNASNFSQEGRSYLSSLGMPSSRYIDLTLGASGSTYIAPANGWFRLVKKPTATGQYILFSSNKYYNGQSNSDQGAIQVSGWTDPMVITIPVLKGDQIICYYNFGGETIKFEFRYAEGEN